MAEPKELTLEEIVTRLTSRMPADLDLATQDLLKLLAIASTRYWTKIPTRLAALATMADLLSVIARLTGGTYNTSRTYITERGSGAVLGWVELRKNKDDTFEVATHITKEAWADVDRCKGLGINDGRIAANYVSDCCGVTYPGEDDER